MYERLKIVFSFLSALFAYGHYFDLAEISAIFAIQLLYEHEAQILSRLTKWHFVDVSFFGLQTTA